MENRHEGLLSRVITRESRSEAAEVMKARVGGGSDKGGVTAPEMCSQMSVDALEMQTVGPLAYGY